jgi:hypothetical protein
MAFHGGSDFEFFGTIILTASQKKSRIRHAGRDPASRKEMHHGYDQLGKRLSEGGRTGWENQ